MAAIRTCACRAGSAACVTPVRRKDSRCDRCDSGRCRIVGTDSMREDGVMVTTLAHETFIAARQPCIRAL